MSNPMMTEKMTRFLNENRSLETPYLLVDLDVIEARYKLLQQALPFAACYYAVKCNSAIPVVERLNQLGSRFEVASIYEVEACLNSGVAPRDIHFGNTIKKESHIRRAHELGIHSFSFDSDVELEKLARAAPGSNVSCRLATDGEGAVWGLCRKFGREPDEVLRLMRHAHDLGLRPYGISFHVGSQQRDPHAWHRAIASAADIMDTLYAEGIHPRLINLGGGFPSADYIGKRFEPGGDIFAYGRTIADALESRFPEGIDCVIEPGRFIASGAGIVHAEVVTLADKKTDGADCRWVYLDIGRFNGLFEANDITYPVMTERDGDATMPSVLAGPTCDSDDVIYDRQRGVELPQSLQVGDRLSFVNAGAYTRSYVTAAFNGFPPMEEIYI